MAAIPPLDPTAYADDVRAALAEHPSACDGVLGVERGGHVRRYLLGAHTRLGGDHERLDWRRAPLARLFFTHAEGEPYALELEDGRTIEGRVVERALTETAGGELCTLERAGRRWRREPGGGWREEPPPTQPIAPRPPAARGRRGPVLLDEAQRRAVALDGALLVLGEAGFGKTTVALHRVAARAASGRADALIVVPTRSLARLARRTLEDLGVRGAQVESYDRWALARARAALPGLPARDARDVTPAISRLKRHPALATVLPAIAARRRGPAVRADLLHLFGDRAILEEVRRASDGAIPRHAIDEVLEHTHVQFSATTEEAHAHVDADRLLTVDGRAIDDGTPTQDAGTLDAEDAAVLLEIHRLRTGQDVGPRHDHVVIDEAQELAPIELALLGRARRPRGLLTVAGDAEQHTDEAALFFGWDRAMAAASPAGHQRVTLAESHRCPPEVTALARCLVGRGPAAGEARGPITRALEASACHQDARLVAALAEVERDDPSAVIAVLTRGPTAARALAGRLERLRPVRLGLGGDVDLSPGVVISCVDELKGLEVDAVVVVDADPTAYPEDPRARRALYVAVTRAMHALWLSAVGEWTPILDAPPP